MKKISKTWKLGEVCSGGVITVEIKGNEITVIGKEWDFSTGSRKSSDQSNAKEFRREVISVDDNNAYRKLNQELCELSTSYWAGEIFKWIETKIKINVNLNGW